MAAAMPALSLGPGAYRLAANRVLHDCRFPASPGLASSLFAAEVVSAVNGDVTRLWQDSLNTGWQQRPVTAGVTGSDVLFCLAQLARDQRLRVQWQQELAPAQPGRTLPALVAWVIAPAEQATNSLTEVIS